MAARASEKGWAFTLTGYVGSEQILGRFQGDEFRLGAGKGYGNHFAFDFFGRIAGEGGETIIEGNFAMDPLAKIFTIGICVLLAICGVLIAVMPSQARWEFRLLSMLALVSVLSGLPLAIRFSWMLADEERKEIEAFLLETLEARAEKGK